jgi:hypothetical protein
LRVYPNAYRLFNVAEPTRPPQKIYIKRRRDSRKDKGECYVRDRSPVAYLGGGGLGAGNPRQCLMGGAWLVISSRCRCARRKKTRSQLPGPGWAGPKPKPTSNYGLAFVFFAIVKDKGVLFVENVKSLLQPIKASTLARCGPDLFA